MHLKGWKGRRDRAVTLGSGPNSGIGGRLTDRRDRRDCWAPMGETHWGPLGVTSTIPSGFKAQLVTG
ncbi:hypothetical protein [Limnothrix redekei]|uniref:Uncharacterized protein n=1 Tax=Limnothrix redekei LRLZ20PSL1 TaxID=3112953 RepID=A0ABW7C933_9CYAN